jgi:hypothetical protein
MHQIDSSSSTGSSRYIKILAIVAIFLFIVFISEKFSYTPSYKHDIYRQRNSECHWYFFNYTPSAWESTWYNNIEVLQQNVCGTLSNAANLNKSVIAMQRIIELQKLGRNQTDGGQDKNNELLSRMFYRQRRIDPRTNAYVDMAEVSHLIEPLIGLLRDPFTVCGRLGATLVPPSLYDGAILLSRRHLLLGVSAPYYITSLIPKRQTISARDLKLDDVNSNLPTWMYKRSKINQSDTIRETGDRRIILFDLGSSYFGAPNGEISDTSTRWFYEYYKRLDLKFDRIIAYEAASLDPKVAWEQLPDDVFPVYTLINTGCTDNGTLYPWMALKRLVKPHDHVVVKVDIDTFGLENFLVNQVLNEPGLHSLIDELYFEHHVSVKEMLAYWRPPPGTLRDSYVLFTKLRQVGIRMHSWP